MKSIGSAAFNLCENLSSASIPDSVTRIGGFAFQGCKHLESITIPASVAVIERGVFVRCYALAEITFEGDAPEFAGNSLYDVTAVAYYPRNNATWTQDVMQNYSGNITWRVTCTDPQGHSYNSVVTAPTCTEQGYTTHTFIRCHDSYMDTYNRALGHDLRHVDAKAPTCTETGWDAYDACSRCDYSTYEEIAAKDHDWVDGLCRNCGEVMTVPTTPMYRLYNPNSGEHFYTGSIEERDKLDAAGWNYEGVAWNAPIAEGATVYRLYNPNSGDHHYTMSAEERDNLVNVGWQYEGVAWNSAPQNHPDSISIHLLYNPNADCGSHHYTGSEEEMANLIAIGWIYKGIGWFGLLK